MCELSPVSFHGDTIFCIDYRNQPYTPIRPIVENMGLDWGSQSVKLNANKERWTVAMIATVAQDGVEREMLSMPVRKLPAWLASINPKKVRAELRPKIELYQAESDDALWNYWMNGRAERQAPEREPAESALLTPAARAELEALVDAKLSICPADTQAKARSEVWTRFNRHFKIAAYAQLPMGRLPEARDYLIRLNLKTVQSLTWRAMGGQAMLPTQIGVGKLPLTGKYRDYLEQVEQWRLANRAEYNRLYSAGMALFEIERIGGELGTICADVVSTWLDKIALSNVSVFYELLTTAKTPVLLAQHLNNAFASAFGHKCQTQGE